MRTSFQDIPLKQRKSASAESKEALSFMGGVLGIVSVTALFMWFVEEIVAVGEAVRNVAISALNAVGAFAASVITKLSDNVLPEALESAVVFAAAASLVFTVALVIRVGWVVFRNEPVRKNWIDFGLTQAAFWFASMTCVESFRWSVLGQGHPMSSATEVGLAVFFVGLGLAWSPNARYRPTKWGTVFLILLAAVIQTAGFEEGVPVSPVLLALCLLNAAIASASVFAEGANRREWKALVLKESMEGFIYGAAVQFVADVVSPAKRFGGEPARFPKDSVACVVGYDLDRDGPVLDSGAQTVTLKASQKASVKVLTPAELYAWEVNSEHNK